MLTSRVYDTYPPLVNGAYLPFYKPLPTPVYASFSMHEVEDKEGLGKRLRSARDACGLTQLEAATKLHITKAALSAWETGRNLPDALMLGRVARIYETTADHLLGSETSVTERLRSALRELEGREPELPHLGGMDTNFGGLDDEEETKKGPR